MRKRFLYWLPTPGCNARMLADRGLHTRFAGLGGDLVEHSITGSEGPAGTGCIVALGAQPAQYDRETQTWMDAGQFWLGIEHKGTPPGPADLVKEFCFNGYDLQLGGLFWTIPRLWRWDSNRLEHVSALPQALRFVNGKLRQCVVPEYEEHEAFAAATFRAFVNEEKVSLEDAFHRAAKLLSMNYRIGVEEASLLGLLDPDSTLKALLYAIDLPAIEKHRDSISTGDFVICTPTAE